MITLYSKPNCPYCENAKAWLTKNEIPYETINIAEDSAARDFIIAEGHKTVPQIYVKTKILVEGGYTGLSKCDPAELKERINVITEGL